LEDTVKRWIVFGFVSCKDPLYEKEFVRWYTEIRHPDLLKGPGIKSARLYKNVRTSGNQPAFLSVYQVEAEDIGPAITYLKHEVARLDRNGRGSDLLVLGEGGVYQEIGNVS